MTAGRKTEAIKVVERGHRCLLGVALRVNGVTVLANLGGASIALPPGEVIVASSGVVGAVLAADSTVWLIE